jgi:DNA polymerase III subunit beta
MIVAEASQADWLAALQRVLGIVERRHTLPILANVLIRKAATSVEFTTSDLELQLRTCAQLGGDPCEFATSVNARKLADILRAMPAEQRVTLRAAGNTLTLRGGKSRFTLQSLPAEAFPLVQEAAGHGSVFELPQAVLKSLIGQVGFAMAVQDIRYFLNGVLFITEGTSLTLVATDGNRLALARATLKHELPAQRVILPRKAVLELQRLLRGGASAAAAVQVRFAAAQATFSFDGIEFVSKLVEGRFPDYQRVIPGGHRHTLTLGRAPLLAGLQRAAILTSEKFRGVRLHLAPGALRIASSNAQHEAADEEIEVDYAGEPLEIGFNVGYLLDALAQADDETVRVDLHDAHSSALLSFPERAGFQYVVSPMRL